MRLTWALIGLALTICRADEGQLDTLFYSADPGTTFGQVGVSSANGPLLSSPNRNLAQNLLNQLNQIGGNGISNHGQGGILPGHGGHHGQVGIHGQVGNHGQVGIHGQVGHHGQGGIFPGHGGQGGYPGGQGGYPGGQGGYPGGQGGYPGGQGGYPGGQGGYPGGQGGYPGRPSSCKYWCRTPEGQAYCCEGGNQNPNPTPRPTVRPGRCPPVRPQCPPTRLFGPPKPCAHDSSCSNYRDKCCFDRCLNEHVCKPPTTYGGGYGR